MTEDTLAKNRIRSLIWYRNNKEKVKERSKKYYVEKRERILDYCKSYYKNNRERIRKYDKERHAKKYISHPRIIVPEINQWWKMSIKMAKRKGMEWGLSLEEYAQLFRKSCFYCGKSTSSQGAIGLDRKINSIGYISGNVVTCCRDCNVVKSNVLSVEEMLVAMKAVLEYRKQKAL